MANIFLDENILFDTLQRKPERALQGPTTDVEDNIQLHSSVEAGCDLFLTHDEALLNLTFFGKMRIASRLPQ